MVDCPRLNDSEMRRLRLVEDLHELYQAEQVVFHKPHGEACSVDEMLDICIEGGELDLTFRATFWQPVLQDMKREWMKFVRGCLTLCEAQNYLATQIDHLLAEVQTFCVDEEIGLTIKQELVRLGELIFDAHLHDESESWKQLAPVNKLPYEYAVARCSTVVCLVEQLLGPSIPSEILERRNAWKTEACKLARQRLCWFVDDQGAEVPASMVDDLMTCGTPFRLLVLSPREEQALATLRHLLQRCPLHLMDIPSLCRSLKSSLNQIEHAPFSWWDQFHTTLSLSSRHPSSLSLLHQLLF